MPQISIHGREIEVRLIPGVATGCPPLVFLHEGLGSVSMWRDFPDHVARRVGAPALVYSRFGYGKSTGLDGPRTPRFMHDEALDVLPALLDQLGIIKPVLIGHSDGASIALIHAAASGRAKHMSGLISGRDWRDTMCGSTMRFTAGRASGLIRAFARGTWRPRRRRWQYRRC